MNKRIKYILILLIAALLASGYFLSRSRTFQFFDNIVHSVPTDQKVVALTFDDGPTEYTKEILDILSAHDVKATFFLTGREMLQHPDLTRQIIYKGHGVGNHSFSHQRMVLKSRPFIEKEVESTDSLIRSLGYNKQIYFRPPYCKKLFYLPYYLNKTNRTTVTWNIEPDSKSGSINNPGLIISDVMTNIKPGSIILLHAMYKNRQSVREALPGIIQGLKQKGYSFVTIDELLSSKE